MQRESDIQIVKEIYTEWRWLKYHNIDSFTIHYESKNPGSFGNLEVFNLSNKIIEQYQRKQFDVSKERIDNYDKQELDKHLTLLKSADKVLPRCIRSLFIENCFIDITQYTEDELLDRVWMNLMHYHCWDLLTYEELIRTLINFYFLKSTKKILSYSQINLYFYNKYESKESLLYKIKENFNPSTSTLSILNDDDRSGVIFDYNFIFRNDLLSSIRILENECRIFNNERVLGSLYNEDFLFKEIVRTFGSRYKIVSQGSPPWLKPQRFDIYFPNQNVAIEYQGEQHFRPVDFGGRGRKHSEKQFKENLNRDLRKRELAVANNCKIIFVNPRYSFNTLIQEVEKALNEQDKNIPF